MNFCGSDEQLAVECTDYCLSAHAECRAYCNGNSSCNFDCDKVLTECLNHCPCHSECPDGCDGCSSVFCRTCQEPETNEQYLACVVCIFYLTSSQLTKSRLTMINCIMRVWFLAPPEIFHATETVSACTRATLSFVRVNQAVRTVVLATCTNVQKQQQHRQLLPQLPPQRKPRYWLQKC